MGKHAPLDVVEAAVADRTPSKLVPSGMVKRAGGFAGLRDLIASKGGDTNSILKRFGIDPKNFDDADAYVSYRAMGQVLEYCAQTFDTAHFGFEVGSRQSADVMGPLALLLLTAPTVAEGLKLVSLHMRVHAPGARLTITSEAGEVEMSYEVLDPRCAVNRQLNEMSMAAARNTMHTIVGPEFSLTGAAFSNAPPLRGDSILARFFDAPIQYNQARNAIFFSSKLLERKIDTSNPVLLRYAKAQCETLLPTSGGIIDLVAAQVRQLMPMGACTLETVARKLSIHPRSLQNRLNAENTDFRDVLKTERQESAKAYLARTHTPISDIASLLGYSDQTSFTRAFSGWFGQSPKRYREQHRKHSVLRD